MTASGAPTVRPVLTYDWGRKFFRHRPDEPIEAQALGRVPTYNGTVLDAVHADPDGTREALFIGSHAPRRPGRRRLLLWHGERRIQVESLHGFLDGRYAGIRARAVQTLVPRLGHVVVLHPDTEPTYVIGLPQFLAAGVSHGMLERSFDAPVAVATEALYSDAGFVPSLRVFVEFDGARYGRSVQKVFYDQNGNPVPVEVVAREVLHRMGYQVVYPALFSRLFRGITGRPPQHFRPGHWAWVDERHSPWQRLARAHAQIDELEEDPVGRVMVRLRGQAHPRGKGEPARPGSMLPVVGRFATRRRLESLLRTLGPERLVTILRGMANGHHAVSADWFAWQEGSGRAFPVEVKSRGDTLRPSQKESILFCQGTGRLEYRLLEVHHDR